MSCLRPRIIIAATILYSAVIAACLLQSQAYAKDKDRAGAAATPLKDHLGGDSAKPLEITAEGSLEWHRNSKFFKAVKKVKATQGGTTLFADILIAKYRESAKDDMQIYLLKADGNVIIESARSKAFGEHATYDIDSATAVISGGDLRLQTSDQLVTARDRFVYDVNAGRLKAIGDAVAIRGDDRLRADEIDAVFTEDKDGKRVLKTLEAKGNVKITSPSDILTGDYGIYSAKTNIAQVKGNVKIMRGQNVLEGDRAQIDLNTNVSSMFAAKGGDGRVRGVFYPGSENKP